MSLNVIMLFALCFVQKIVKRSQKLIARLACRDPDEDLDEIQPTPQTTESSAEWEDTDVEDRFDDAMFLSQTRGAPEPTQTSPESSQQPRGKKNKRQPLETSRTLPRRGGRERKAKLQHTPQEELGKRKGRK